VGSGTRRISLAVYEPSWFLVPTTIAGAPSTRSVVATVAPLSRTIVVASTPKVAVDLSGKVTVTLPRRTSSVPRT
jgi:hypothetical protein